MQMRRSQWLIAMLAKYVPCIPGIPRKRGSEPGKAPRPMSVDVTGSFARRANDRSSSVAFPSRIPPPVISRGRLEARSISSSCTYFLGDGLEGSDSFVALILILAGS